MRQIIVLDKQDLNSLTSGGVLTISLGNGSSIGLSYDSGRRGVSLEASEPTNGDGPRQNKVGKALMLEALRQAGGTPIAPSDFRRKYFPHVEDHGSYFATYLRNMAIQGLCQMGSEMSPLGTMRRTYFINPDIPPTNLPKHASISNEEIIEAVKKIGKPISAGELHMKHYTARGISLNALSGRLKFLAARGVIKGALGKINGQRANLYSVPTKETK